MWNFSRFDFFSETRPLLGHFLKKSVFFPLEMSNTCKNFLNPKIAEKWLSIGTPPFFSPKFFFTKMTQNGLKWILNITFKTVHYVKVRVLTRSDCWNCHVSLFLLLLSQFGPSPCPRTPPFPINFSHNYSVWKVQIQTVEPIGGHHFLFVTSSRSIKS